MSTATSSILLLGASGRTGKLVLAEALRRGRTVVALVRNQNSLEVQPELTIVEGTPLRPADLERAFDAAFITAIVSTLGQTRKSGSPWAQPTSPRLFMAEAIKNAISVAKRRSLAPKLVVMSLFGVGDSFKNNNFLMRWVFNNSAMDKTIEDGNAVDEAVKSSGLTYVLVRSTALMGEAATPIRDLGDSGEQAGFMPSISPVTVASFLLDAIPSDQWDGRTPVISA